jgi:hypothetical protein
MKKMEPHLPDGTPTASLPCRFCRHPRRDHRDGGVCFGSLKEVSESIEIDPVALGNMRRGHFDFSVAHTQPVQPACTSHCLAYCAPGGIEGSVLIWFFAPPSKEGRC